jgi:UDP-N-acetylmuramyl tripeptide synthase
MVLKLKYFVPIAVTKALINIIKFSKSGAGTNLPGKAARKLSPKILSSLVRQTKKEILVVTGTNGKTTTSGFIAGILNADGRKTVHNKRGANMLTGLTTAVIEQSSLFGNLNPDNCLFEIDEAFFVKAVEEFTPDFVLVTNLFRDQLDRYGELNTTAKKIEQAINKTAQTKIPKVILNADDPIVSSLGEVAGESRIYYGLEEIKFVNQDENINTPQETTNCKCGERYLYEKVFYGHLGHFYCKCGHKRPKINVSAKAVVDISFSELIIKTENKEEFSVKINMPGLYNVYNALSAITMALELGISIENIKKGLENYSTVFGRAETLILNKKPTLIQLIKNPIGATEVLRTVKDDPNGRLLIIINDNYADGRDVSWLWDANFELLKDYGKTIIVSGVRATDMAVRLKYAGIPAKNIVIIEDIEQALKKSLSSVQETEKLYILPTYTALLNLQKIQRKFLQNH